MRELNSITFLAYLMSPNNCNHYISLKVCWIAYCVASITTIIVTALSYFVWVYIEEIVHPMPFIGYIITVVS